ncbi:TetR/AcrR family transcriptional regulator [Brumimicrobium salinarum]|uniref:TetR/AcrR family transcriptional regulator n=1 Tax=Brumimicrobium salinarum TaxID=2058658 RepID=A0A2I0R6R8_9FLAO|nr:TetR/AcrR family transcriptional regulator [Brumimicrobium salinarum]PKR82267.1 TetR/AcrR family transcriptional regulator [Brumimicrobium salinarum]
MSKTEFTPRQIEIMEAATQRIDKHGIQNLTIKTLAADINLSEPALYRHFAGKNEILLGLLEYFKIEMKERFSRISFKETDSAGDQLRTLFRSQLATFAEKPAIVSVIFAESIFHFDKSLSNKVSEIIAFMQDTVKDNIKKGQEERQYSTLINSGTMTTIITGGMRMAVMKWKLSGNKSSVVKDGMKVLNGILKMIEK